MDQICTTSYEYQSSTLATTTQDCTPKGIEFYYAFYLTAIVFLVAWYVGYKLMHPKKY